MQYVSKRSQVKASTGEIVITIRHLDAEELEAGLERILGSPNDKGSLEMIVRRPSVDAREVLKVGELDVDEVLLGDNWKARGSHMTNDGASHPEMQLNLMNARVANLVAQTRERWPLAGDQLYVDLNLDPKNLPTGTRLRLGGAEIEVTGIPHLGCSKFVARFGRDAMLFVNSRRGKCLNLRGINARVVTGGRIATGGVLKKI